MSQLGRAFQHQYTTPLQEAQPLNYKLTSFKVSLLQKLDSVLFASHCRFLPLGEQLAEYFVSLTLCVFSSSNLNGQERKIRGMKVLASSARRNMTYFADLIERGREWILLRNSILLYTSTFRWMVKRNYDIEQI